MRVSVRLARLKPDQRQPDRMTCGFEHGTKQYGHVIAIARFQFDHPPGGMQQLNLKNVSRVTDVSPHPIKERADFAETIFGPHVVIPKNLNGFLPDVKIFCAIADQTANQARCHQRPARPCGNAMDDNARNNEAWADIDHRTLWTLNIQKPFNRNYHRLIPAFDFDHGERFLQQAVIG